MARFGLLFVTLLLGLTGCRNQSPYSFFGPTTVPPPGMPSPLPAGYYPPTTPPGVPGTSPPSNLTIPQTGTQPSLGLAPLPPRPADEPGSASLAGKTIPATSFASRDNFTAEAPIRIVEAAPAAGRGSTFSSVLPFREPPPPSVVQAMPAGRDPAGSGTPGVQFNSSSPAAEMSQLPRPGIQSPSTPAVPLNKTRGYLPAPTGGSGSFRTDESVKPVGFIEATPSPAAGQWRSR